MRTRDFRMRMGRYQPGTAQRRVLLGILYSLAMTAVCRSIAAQEGAEATLRRGQYFTEAQAAEFMQAKLAQYPTREAWERDTAIIREEIFNGLGLNPLPRRTPLDPMTTGKRDMPGYTVENVAFQSIPGYYVTCNLYRPTRPGPYPVVINFHGHGSGGRLRPGMDARSVALARMGAIALTVDMVGAGESPVPTAQHATSLSMKMQVWNAVRAIDFVTSLAEVDDKRIAVTGASGGGTQSFLVTALDDRVAVSAPVAMVSSHFFGGCKCESGLPIHKSARHDINNVVIAAMAAPRPMILVSDGGDWTVNTPDIEFPFVRHIYRLLGAPDLVENSHFPAGKHDYDENKRAAVYPFLAKHLNLDLTAIQDAQGKITEAWFVPIPDKDLAVFNQARPMPEDALRTPEAIEAKLRALQAAN